MTYGQVFVNIETRELSDREADHYLDHDPSLASALDSPCKYKDSMSTAREFNRDDDPENLSHGERDGGMESGMDVVHELEYGLGR